MNSLPIPTSMAAIVFLFGLVGCTASPNKAAIQNNAVTAPNDAANNNQLLAGSLIAWERSVITLCLPSPDSLPGITMFTGYELLQSQQVRPQQAFSGTNLPSASVMQALKIQISIPSSNTLGGNYVITTPPSETIDGNTVSVLLRRNSPPNADIKVLGISPWAQQSLTLNSIVELTQLAPQEAARRCSSLNR